METFIERLQRDQEQKESMVCAGVDPDIDKLPKGSTGQVLGRGSFKRRLLEINMAYVKAVAPYVCIIKPNLAFWAAHGAEDELAILIKYAQSLGLMVILDAKYGDIGNTAKFYARTAFDRYNADAVTINAYLGTDTLDPWLDYGLEHAIFVLCHTSNKGAGEFQEQLLAGSQQELFLHLAERVTDKQSDGQTQIGLVMGATFPGQIERLKDVVPTEKTPLLLPGIGKQGGDLEETIRLARCHPFVVNSSGGLLHASQKPDFAQVAAEKANELRKSINAALAVKA